MEQILKYLKASSNIGDYFSDDVITNIATEMQYILSEVSTTFTGEKCYLEPNDLIKETLPKIKYEMVNGRHERIEIKQYLFRVATNHIRDYSELFFRCLQLKIRGFRGTSLWEVKLVKPIHDSAMLSYIPIKYRNMTVNQLLEVAENGIEESKPVINFLF